MGLAVGDRRYDRRATETQRQERSAKSKGRFFSLRLDPPEEPIKIHFQKPKEPYQDPRDPNVAYNWKKGAKHYIPRFKKFLECAFKKCLTCAYRHPNDFGFEGVPAQQFLKDCWPKDYYSLCGWVEEWHLIVERESERKGDDGKPKTFLERVIERQARKELKEAGYDLKKLDLPRVFGKRFYFDISGPAWHNEFNAVYETVERITKDGGYLFPLHYGCANCEAEFEPITTQCPSCESEEVGVDHEKHKAFCGSCDTEWELLEHRSKELKKLAETLFECAQCKHQGYPIPVMARVDLKSGDVTTERPNQGWDTYDIFDIQLTIRKEKPKEDSPPRIVIDDWCIQPPDPKLFDAAHQGGKDDQDAIEMARKHSEPLNLEGVHQIDLPAVQAKILKLDDLFSSKQAAMSNRVVRYGKKNGTNGQAQEEETEEGAEDETEE